jgi:hypothetical protein
MVTVQTVVVFVTATSIRNANAHRTHVETVYSGTDDSFLVLQYKGSYELHQTSGVCAVNAKDLPETEGVQQ